MKKLLFLLVVAAVAFTGCIKENNDYKLYKKVAPGISIYSATNNLMVYGTQPARIGMRVAILAAEAQKQGEDSLNLVTVKINNTSMKVKELLLGTSVWVNKLENNDYQVTFKQKYSGTGAAYEGVVTIRTNGKKLLSETDNANSWTVVLGDKFTITEAGYNGNGTRTTTYSGGETKMFSNLAGSYVLQPMLVTMNNGSKLTATLDAMPSDGGDYYGSGLLLTPPKDGLAYSDCSGKLFEIEGAVGGPSFVSFDNISATKMKYQVVKGKFVGNYFVDGMMTCTLYDGSDYDVNTYVKNYVEVIGVFNEQTSVSTLTLIYNGTNFRLR